MVSGSHCLEKFALVEAICHTLDLFTGLDQTGICFIVWLVQFFFNFLKNQNCVIVNDL